MRARCNTVCEVNGHIHGDSLEQVSWGAKLWAQTFQPTDGSQHGEVGLTLAVAFSTLSLQLRYLRSRPGSQSRAAADRSPALLPGLRRMRCAGIPGVSGTPGCTMNGAQTQ